MLRVKLDVLENALDNWKRRKPAVSGKINFVKSVGLLKLLIYFAPVLPVPENVCNQVKKITFKFTGTTIK